jgi:hypothetical protein
MSQASEMSEDLRGIILCDEAALVNLSFQGRVIKGTKGDLVTAMTFDRDDGGLYSDDKFTATFVLSDFPTSPIGEEIVFIDGEQKRILNVKTDDFGVAVALDFTSPNEQ